MRMILWDTINRSRIENSVFIPRLGSRKHVNANMFDPDLYGACGRTLFGFSILPLSELLEPAFFDSDTGGNSTLTKNEPDFKRRVPVIK